MRTLMGARSSARLPLLVLTRDSARGRFLRLVGGRLEEMLVHRASRRLGVVRANRLIDPAVRFGGVDEIAIRRPLRGAAAAIVIERRDRFDERADDGIAGRLGDDPVESDVV